MQPNPLLHFVAFDMGLYSTGVHSDVFGRVCRRTLIGLGALGVCFSVPLKLAGLMFFKLTNCAAQLLTAGVL